MSECPCPTCDWVDTDAEGDDLRCPGLRRMEAAEARLAEWTLAWNELRLVMADGGLPWSPHLRRLDELAAR